MSITPEAKMRKYLLLFAAIAAIALTVAVVSGLNTHRQAFSARPYASIIGARVGNCWRQCNYSLALRSYLQLGIRKKITLTVTNPPPVRSD